LYRYNADGTRAFDTAFGGMQFYSLDGTHDLVQFSQDDQSDRGDWNSDDDPHISRVQDAFLFQGAIPNPDIELTRLDVLGYTRANLTVQPFTTTTLSSASIPLGGSTTFTAAVQPAYPTDGSPTPTGAVQFQIDGKDFGSPVELVNGVATSLPV